MKDIPSIAWILILFVILAVGTLLYSRSGDEPLPDVQNIWEHVEGFRENLKFRRLALPAGTNRERIVKPYKIIVSRLPDQTLVTGVLARYLLSFEVASPYPAGKAWGGFRVDIALIDTKMTELIGDVRIVSLHKAEIKN